jgi:acetyltransferase-like isoleucine patch superfamily enzyme
VSTLFRIPVVRRVLMQSQNRLFQARYAHEVGPGAGIFGWPIVTLVPGSELRAGRRLVLISDSTFSGPGVAHPCVLRCLLPGARITIGDDVAMSGASICASVSVEIGDQVLVGANAVITDTDFHPLAPEHRRWSEENVGIAPVVIGANVFLGMNSMVLKGVTVGRDAVIAAGSVVVHDVPAGAIVAGVPGRVVGMVPGYETSDSIAESTPDDAR